MSPVVLKSVCYLLSNVTEHLIVPGETAIELAEMGVAETQATTSDPGLMEVSLLQANGCPEGQIIQTGRVGV